MLTAAQLLAVWERGLDLAAFERALLLLQSAAPEQGEDLARLSIGQRDALLLDLRERIFGSALPCLIACPACGERLELNLDVADLRVASESGSMAALRLESEGYDIEFRLPNSLDLAAVNASGNIEESRERLLERCLVTVRRRESGEPAIGALPFAVQEAVIAKMAAADPQSHLELALACLACEHAWQTVFDIATYFWSEIQNWAMRLLREVHALASAYGWREHDILAMSPLRRRLYLDMVGA